MFAFFSMPILRFVEAFEISHAERLKRVEYLNVDVTFCIFYASSNSLM